MTWKNERQRGLTEREGEYGRPERGTGLAETAQSRIVALQVGLAKNGIQ